MDDPIVDHAPSLIASGIVYIATNPAMPDYVKIGRTSNLIQRMAQLNSSSVPLPFVCAYAALVAHPSRVEHTLHALFAKFRSSADREFFTIDVQLAIDALQLMQHQNVTDTAYPVGAVRRDPKPVPVTRAFNAVHLSPLIEPSHAEVVETALRDLGGRATSQRALAKALNLSHGQVSKMLRNCPNVERVREDNRKVVRLKAV
jgi:hypothetical protein